MDSLSFWPHYFLTHAPLDKLSGFEYEAEAGTCWCCKRRSSRRAACLEVRGASLCYAPVAGSQQCPPASSTRCMALSVSPAVHSPPGCAQTPRAFGSGWLKCPPTSIPFCLWRPVANPWSCLGPDLLCNESSVWVLSRCAVWFALGFANQFPALAHSQRRSFSGEDPNSFLRKITWLANNPEMRRHAQGGSALSNLHARGRHGAVPEAERKGWSSRRLARCRRLSPASHGDLLLLVPAWVTAHTLGHRFWACPTRLDSLNPRTHGFVNCAALGRLWTSIMTPWRQGWEDGPSGDWRYCPPPPLHSATWHMAPGHFPWARRGARRASVSRPQHPSSWGGLKPGPFGVPVAGPAPSHFYLIL